MQKTKTIQIGPRSFTLKELPVRVIWDLTNNSQAKKSAGMPDLFQDLLHLACPELNQEVLLELYPSEVEELWQAFEEVNTAFLGVVRRIGLIDILIDGVKPVLKLELTKAMAAVELTSTSASASSLPAAMVPASGTTATASS